MLTPEGKVYLIDLDAAMQLAPEKKSDTQLLGTAVYAAPEQFGLTRSDVRTDIYAVGILLNILLTGVHPAVEQYRSGDQKTKRLASIRLLRRLVLCHCFSLDL